MHGAYYDSDYSSLFYFFTVFLLILNLNTLNGDLVAAAAWIGCY